MRGFRRFGDKQLIRVSGKLTAIVGPNEAGKTSLLVALASLSGEAPIPSSDLTRWAEPPSEDLIVWAEFDLQKEEENELAAIPEARNVSRLIVAKRVEGSVEYHVRPKPERDRAPRKRVASTMLKVADSRWLAGLTVAESDEGESEEPPLEERLRTMANTLGQADEDIDDDVLSALNDLGVDLDRLVTDRAPKYARELAGQALNLRQSESGPHPADAAVSRLLSRVPEFLFFSSADRALRSEYSVQELRDQGTPAALANLADLADLNLDLLMNAIDSGNSAVAQTLVSHANRVLDGRLKEWSQADIICTIDAETAGRTIRVHAGTESNLWNLEDRSAGFQWFVALVAFLYSRRGGVSPVLLVDEAEQHLHYDAQADLVNTMESQDLAASVIYTTHSAGCLPQDLSSVRIVQPGDNDRSSIRNWFWESHDAGLSPLIMQMGATRFAFVHSRAALICEGPSDFLLLPRLFREAADLDSLGFQVAPGLAEVANQDLHDLDAEAGRVAYLVDNDGGGNEIRRSLRRAGVDDARIFQLRGGVTVEDFIDEELLAKSLTAMFQYQEATLRFPVQDLPRRGRWQAIEAWAGQRGLNAPSKRPLAHAVLERADGRIMQSQRRTDLLRLHDGVCEVLRPSDRRGLK